MAAAEEEPTAEQQRQWTAEAEGAQQLLLAGLRERDVRVVRDQIFTRTFNGFSAVVSPRALAELERAHDVAGVYPVRTVYPAAPTAETIAGGDFQPGGGRGTQISLPGFSGSGVTIALLDSGVDRRHAYLRGRVARGFDVVDGDTSVAPEAKPGEPGVVEAHGTRMAGLLVGHDGPSGLQGVAPGARVLPIRVMGWQQTADGSWAVLGRGDLLLAGLERAVDPDGDGDVEDAAAIALVGGVQPYAAFASSPEARATAGATALGTLVVAPVGNDGRPGPGFGTVAAPAAAAEALAVGTLDARREVLEADAQLRVGDDTVLDEPVRVLGGAAPHDGPPLRGGVGGRRDARAAGPPRRHAGRGRRPRRLLRHGRGQPRRRQGRGRAGGRGRGRAPGPQRGRGRRGGGARLRHEPSGRLARRGGRRRRPGRRDPRRGGTGGARRRARRSTSRSRGRSRTRG